MIALFLYVILAISLAAGAGYAVFSVIRSNDTLTLAQRNQAIMQNVAQVIRANVIREGGFLLAPAPDGAQVPAWIAEFARTPWGADYRYCAFTTMEGGPDLDPPVGYAVEVEDRVPLFGQAEQSFVTGQMVGGVVGPFSGVRNYPFNLVAAVVSPGINGAEAAACNEITYELLDNGTEVWSVPAGSVVAVTEDMFPIGGVASGNRSEMLRMIDGDGEDDDTVGEALAAWQAQDFRPAIFRFTGGDEITLNQSDFDTYSPTFFSRSGRLSLIGPSNDVRAELVGTVEIPLRTDTTIRFIDFGPNVTLVAYPGVTVTIENSTVTGLVSHGATIQAGRDVQFVDTGTDADAFTFDGGRFEILRSSDEEVGQRFRVTRPSTATSAIVLVNADLHIAQNVEVTGSGITATTWALKEFAPRITASATLAGSAPTLTVNGGTATEIANSPAPPTDAPAGDNSCMLINDVTYGCESVCTAPTTLKTGGCVGSPDANLLMTGPNEDGDGWFCSWSVVDATQPPSLSSNALCSSTN